MNTLIIVIRKKHNKLLYNQQETKIKKGVNINNKITSVRRSGTKLGKPFSISDRVPRKTKLILLFVPSILIIIILSMYFL